MEILSKEEMRIAEEETIKDYIPSVVLMENAAEKVVQVIKSEYENLLKKNIIVVCGEGNNGGDGFAIARKLLNIVKSVKIKFYGDKDKLPVDAKSNYNAAVKLGIEFMESRGFDGADIIVDAIFGIGVTREITGELKDIIEEINKSDKNIVSVDIPSGIECDSGKIMGIAVKSDITVTFQRGKYCHFIYPGKEFCGKVFMEDIGIPEKIILKTAGIISGIKREIIEKKDVVIKKRESNINKVSAGKVLIVAGKTGFSGAAYMCAESCLRAGAGLVFLAIPESINTILESKTTEIITIPLKDGKKGNLTLESFEEIEKFVKENRIETVVIGPGLGREEETIKVIIKIIENISARFLIDADALFAIKECMDILKGKEIVITPHEGEFEKIICKKIINRIEDAEELADKHGITVVLKGAGTIITNGKETFINTSGNQGLAKGGSGDVLAGIIAAFISRGYSLEIAAKQGVYIHGYIADYIAINQSMESITATDLINNIGKVMKEFENMEQGI